MNRLQLNATHKQYPIKLYGNLHYLREINSSNYQRYLRGITHANVHVETDFLLREMLANLRINPEWDLDYLIKYLKVKAKSIASLFKVSSPNQLGKQYNGSIWYKNTQEYFYLTPMRYTPDIYMTANHRELNVITPIYSRERNHTYLYPDITRFDHKDDGYVEIYEVDLIGLGILYWKFYRDSIALGSDRLSYWYFIADIMGNIQRQRNNLAIFNLIYDYYVHDKPIVWNYFKSDFNAVNPTMVINKFLRHLTTYFDKHYVLDETNLFQMITNIYHIDDIHFADNGEYGYLKQCGWGPQFQTFKVYQLLLAISNKHKNKKQVVSINERISQWGRSSLTPFIRSLPESLEDEAIEQTKLLFQLNEINY